MRLCLWLGLLFGSRLGLWLGLRFDSRFGLRFGLRLASALVLLTTVYGAQGQALVSARDEVRGANGPYRANNDLLFYHLDVRVDPVAKSIRGTNTIRFRMLADGTRIQLELTPALRIEGVRFRRKELKSTREGTTFFVDFPDTLKRGKTYEIKIAYAGEPKEVGRFGGMAFRTDPQGRPWVVTSCEDEGSSVWWPSKDQWRDEPQKGVVVSVAVPNALTAVSNGRLLRKKDLHDGYTRWDWRVTYPINSYDVALNIADYTHFGDQLGKLKMDYYVLPENLAKAKTQFAQAKPMLAVYQKYFGPYPFQRDGYKLVEVPYAGMEHQSAVAYGNGFHNSYLDYNHGDWTGVGISPRFDFILIHESGHEWFGNSVTAADPADMWIHEGFTTYMEAVFVEAMYGHADEVKYVNSWKRMVFNEKPVLQPRGVNQQPDRDQYFKGALFLNTLRTLVNDDAKWFATLHDVATHFAYQTILTEDVIAFMNQRLGADYTPVFQAYLRYKEVPTLQLRYDDEAGTVDYRWRTPETDFAMPVRAGDARHWTLLHPTTMAWQTASLPVKGKRSSFAVDTGSYFIDVDRNDDAAALARKGWKLTWSDEFDGPDGSAPDPAKWSFVTGGSGFGNNELETYTDRSRNVRISQGKLAITALKEDFTGSDGIQRGYTSGRLETKGHFAQAYGRVEARIRIPKGGQGIWPAFWMLGDNIDTVGWPKGGEIDIMENVGKEPDQVHGTLHGPGYSGGNPLTSAYTMPDNEAVSDDFHIFGVEWEPGAVRFYVDGELYVTRTPKDVPAGREWVYDHPFFILLNVAVGGKWPGNPDATTTLPTTMMVDWVRVYAREPK